MSLRSDSETLSAMTFSIASDLMHSSLTSGGFFGGTVFFAAMDWDAVNARIIDAINAVLIKPLSLLVISGCQDGIFRRGALDTIGWREDGYAHNNGEYSWLTTRKKIRPNC